MVKQPQTHHAHDRSQRLLFEHAQVVRDLLSGFVREPWVEEIDLGSLENLSAELLSGELPGRYEERRSDVISWLGFPK